MGLTYASHRNHGSFGCILQCKTAQFVTAQFLHVMHLLEPRSPNSAVKATCYSRWSNYNSHTKHENLHSVYVCSHWEPHTLLADTFLPGGSCVTYADGDNGSHKTYTGCATATGTMGGSHKTYTGCATATGTMGTGTTVPIKRTKNVHGSQTRHTACSGVLWFPCDAIVIFRV